MRTTRAGTALALTCLLGAGCASTTTRVYTMEQPKSAPATWNGRNVDEVLEAWGPPSARQSDGEGGTLLVYEEKTGVNTSATEGAPSPPDLSPSRPEGTTTTQEIKRPRAKFWVDAQGKVYRFWFAADVYRKGLDTPPAKKPAPSEEGES